MPYNEKFSTLLSVYKNEKPAFLNQALNSIWDNQTLKPAQIVLVKDGLLTPDLDACIEQWSQRLGEVFTVVALPFNVGLGAALNEGLKHCRFDLVARMDTDDISLNNRFERQIPILLENNIDICGTWVSEFNSVHDAVSGYRKLPETHNEIVNYARKRNPFNHPSVCFKKDAVMKCGGYQSMPGFEDYYLWVRMLLNGAKFYNIQEPLVNMRAGNGQLQRRSGWSYAKKEIIFLNSIYKLKFIATHELFLSVLLRVPVRLLPKSFVGLIYRALHR